MSERERRLAENEAFFRHLNERIGDVVVTTPTDTGLFVCECGDADCVERIELTGAEYESVRSSQTSFVVKPGHEIPDIERIAVRRDGYLVIEKFGEAAATAGEHDPRG